MKARTLNQIYFEEINSEDKAYFLGLLYADGYNCERHKSQYVEITLQDRDREILELFNDIISNKTPVRTLERKASNGTALYYARLQVSSKIFSSVLSLKGCHQNKSFTVSFPDENIIPSELVRHFIRGYFDGNGCVWEGKRKLVVCKDKLRQSGSRERIVHNVKVTLTGSTLIISEIQKIFHTILGLRMTKLNTTRCSKGISMLEYSGRTQMGKLYDYLYFNSTISLSRKKEKFESILSFNNNLIL